MVVFEKEVWVRSGIIWKGVNIEFVRPKAGSIRNTRPIQNGEGMRFYVNRFRWLIFSGESLAYARDGTDKYIFSK